MQALGENADLTLLAVTAADIEGQGQWVTAEGCLRTLPCHAPLSGAEGALQELRGMDGFFAARLVRAR